MRLLIHSLFSSAPWLHCCAAILLPAALACAQENTGTTGGGSAGGAGAASGAGSAGSAATAPDASSSLFPSGGTPASPGAASSFGTSGTNSPAFRNGGPTLPGTPEPATPGGAASTFGDEESDTGAAARSAPASFSIPGFYGRGPLEFTAGEGRLARPRFRTSASVSIGYDDNVFQTPTDAEGIPDQRVQVQTRAATAATTQQVTDPNTGAVTTVTVPGQPAQFRTETIEGSPAPERIDSFITRTDVNFDVQFATRRSLFTFDFSGGVDYYFNRPGDKVEYNGSLGLIYLYRLTSRAQFTAAISASYQTQPDFSQVNSPSSNNRDSYLQANVKADLSYRLTPRFSTVTSISYNTVLSVEEGDQGGDFGETTFGTELRYLFSPRLTLLGEVRYSSATREEASADNSTYFFLVGGELTLSRRFVTTLRVGEALRTFENDGEDSSSPYVESTLSYRLARGTTVQWNVRYGFEQSGDANSRSLIARTGLSLSQIFSPRLQGSLSLNLLHNEIETTSEVAVADNDNNNGTPGQPQQVRTETVTTDSTQDTVDATVALSYALSRRWSFTLSYSYTLVLGPSDRSDYYRQRVFLGAEYEF